MELICWDTWLMGWGKAAAELEEGGDGSQGDPPHAADSQGAADDGDEHILQVAQVGVDGHEDVGEHVGGGGLAAQLVVAPVEVRLGGLLMAENLDHLLAVDHFLDIAVDVAQGFLLLDEEAAAASADEAGDQQHHPDAQQHQRRQHQIGE